MSISSPKETLNSDFGNENDNLNKESNNINIKNIYPKAKTHSKVIKLEDKINTPRNEKKGDIYELNKEFLFALIQPVFLLDKQKMYNTISTLIKNSKLSQKIEKESDIKDNTNNLITTFVQNLSFKKIDKENILFYTGETDYKFYFIIKGSMSQLKAKKHHLKMPFVEFISYLIELQRNNENYILNNVLLSNSKDIPIKSVDVIQRLNTIIFKKKLIEKISLETITNNNELEAFFKEYYQDFSSHLLSKKELKKLEKNKNKIIMGAVNREWDDYIIEKCHPNSDDLLLFEPFEEIYKDNNHSYIIYIYEINANYGPGSYFGDFSLEEVKTVRNETIRADEDTFLGYITNDEYVNIVSPRRKIEKRKEINLLNNSHFFKNISERIFKKNYYEMFIKKAYSMKTILFNSGSRPKSLIFLKKGKISLVLNCSIIEMHNLIQLIYIKLNKISWPYDTFQKKILTKENLKAIEKKFFNEPILQKMKTFNKIFKLELEKKRKFQIALFSDVEIIGLEEIYLKIPYIAKGIVVSEKIVFHELPLDKFNIILQDEIRNITESYVTCAINRVLSLMERLNNLKQNFINIARIKSEAASSDNNIKSINNSFDSNKEYNMNKKNKNSVLNNINPVKNNRLNINNSKTLIPTLFTTKINDEFRNKSDSTDKERSHKNSRVNSTKFRTEKKSAFTRKKYYHDTAHSSYRKKSSVKNVNNLKSANRTRDNKFTLEKNELSERAGSVKLSELLKRIKNEKMGKTPKRKNDYIIIGNNKISINILKKKMNEYKTFNDFNENKNLNESKDIKTIFSSDTDYIKIEEQYKSQILSKEQNMENNKEKNINSIKTNDTSINNKNYKSIINTNEQSGIKDRHTSIDLHVSQFNKINKINYTKLLINPISPMSINNFNTRNLKSIKNKKVLNIGKININKKVITTSNTSNNLSIINQTSNTNTNTNNNDTSIMSILPKIQQKPKFTEYIFKTSISNKKNYNKKVKNERIPEIVKEYYSQIRRGGYIPLITNKESNTIFLRKYHKKYKDAQDQSQNRSLSKNEGILPKIYNG